MWRRWGRKHGFGPFSFHVPPFGFMFYGGRPFPRREAYQRMLEEYRDELQEELKEVEKELEELKVEKE
ncbi:MAG: hypothetical protein HYU86_02620 [Chloroflexi bacterium]|nr:hypothetical protein [Chloroflexota bacterium]